MHSSIKVQSVNRDHMWIQGDMLSPLQKKKKKAWKLSLILVSFYIYWLAVKGLLHELDSLSFPSRAGCHMLFYMIFYGRRRISHLCTNTQLICCVCLHFTHVFRQPPNRARPKTLASERLLSAVNHEQGHVQMLMMWAVRIKAV